MRLENYPPIIEHISLGWYVCMDPQQHGGPGRYYLHIDGVVRSYARDRAADSTGFYTTKEEAQRTLDEYIDHNTFSEVV